MDGHFQEGLDMTKLATIELPAGNTNAFEILAICQAAAEKAKVDKSKIQGFLEVAVSGDFEHLTRAVNRYFDVSTTA